MRRAASLIRWAEPWCIVRISAHANFATGGPMKTLLIASTIGFALASGSAMAADLPLKSPAPVVSWTGCYVDGGIGYGLWNQKHYAEFDTPFTPESPTVNTGGEGWLGRAGGGCDFQIGSN